MMIDVHQRHVYSIHLCTNGAAAFITTRNGVALSEVAVPFILQRHGFIIPSKVTLIETLDI